jgi:hypothetical protein
MGNVIHKTVPIQVWVDVDEGIVEFVRELNDIPGVRTHASCQGTLGEGGAEPYRAFVSVSWDRDETLRTLAQDYDLKRDGNNHGVVYPPAPDNTNRQRSHSVSSE